MAPATAQAHGTTAPNPFDAAAPTLEHAKEHEATGKLIDKIRKMTPAQREGLRRKSLGTDSKKAKRLADQPVGPASKYGAWTTAPFKAPTYGIHGVLMPSGRILLMSMGSGHSAGNGGAQNLGQDVNNDGAAAIWDPSRGTGTDAFKVLTLPSLALADPSKRKGYNKPRAIPIYCSGHVQMADGRVLIAGANLEAGNGGFGLKLLFLFDPWTEKFVRQQDMAVARWYPTLTRLPNGQVVILSGRDEKGVMRPEVEIYPGPGQPIPGIDNDTAPAVNGSAVVKNNRTIPSFYPHSYVMRNNKLAIIGPSQIDQGLVDLNTWAWTNLPGNGFRQGANGYPASWLETGTTQGPERVTALGGLTTKSKLHNLVSTIRPGIDTRWTDQAGLKLARRNSPAVILPDGNVIAIGGGQQDLRTTDPMASWPTRRQPELYDPVTKTWSLGPAQQRPRGYHSIAVLLPDGRVMSGGDDVNSVLFDDNTKDVYDTNFELYSPPYLFKGPRPVLSAAPKRVSYGNTFNISVEGSAFDIQRVTVVSPASNTHALDMNQRHLDLQIVGRSGNEVTVIAPPTAPAAPPGDYMIFALTGEGVPSVAKWIQILPPGAPGHSATSGPEWSTTPNPEPEQPEPTTPQPTTPTTTTPTTPPVVTPPKAPRPWWWPIFLPWNG